MRVGAVLLCLLALGACGDRRDFDERYNDAGAELENRARAIDQNLANELPADERDGNSSE
ncbi:hypothetical protein GGQ97_001366 [Sphingomonas kaistensis]|uniref:Lipoprotein n=1 Tax=Sphingomonas kaistensis TaxID=298708 RepID=A0A7X6BG66_9SPHN|nr:hypothetical protein [Sphingomonas kaistensis]NJC05573.1 hypothetical protein [Sphingomonas kaistensis]